MTHIAKKSVAVLSFAIAGVLGAMPARAALFADGPASAPVTTGAPATGPGAVIESLKVTVVEVNGNVQVRGDESQPWQPATVGMVVGEGAEFRTSMRSSVRCTIPPDQSFTLDRLGTVKVLQALKNGTKLKTDMLMKYGRTSYSVEAAGLEHEGTIASPSGTLAVRGTVTQLYDQPPFAPQAVSYTGRVFFRDAHREVAFGGKGSSKQTLDAGKNGPGETALSTSVVDPKYAGARTAADNALIAAETSRGAFASFDPLANIAVLRGGTPIRNDAQFAQQLPGKLDFTARWFGNADINIEVFAQFGNPLSILFSTAGFQPTEFLYPGYGLNNSKSGGHIPFDHRGGPNGGTEIAYWINPPPNAVYGIVAQHISGDPVDVKLNAFLNGQKQSIFYTDAGGNFVKSKTLDMTVGGTNFSDGLVFIAPVDLLESTTPSVGDTGDATPSGRHTRTSHSLAGAGAGSGGGSSQGPGQSGNQGPSVQKLLAPPVKPGAAVGHTR